MTAEEAGKWILQVALVTCSIGGVAIVAVAVRTGWIKTAITWALVSFALVGGMMILSPRWTSFAIEWKDLKARLSKLEEEKKYLIASNEKYADLIQTSNTLREFYLAGEKSNQPDYKLIDFTSVDQFADDLAGKLNIKPEEIKKALSDSKYIITEGPIFETQANIPSNVQIP